MLFSVQYICFNKWLQELKQNFEKDWDLRYWYYTMIVIINYKYFKLTPVLTCGDNTRVF